MHLTNSRSPVYRLSKAVCQRMHSMTDGHAAVELTMRYYLLKVRAQEPEEEDEDKRMREVMSDALAALLADPYLFTEWMQH
jgi:hypothetical protein